MNVSRLLVLGFLNGFGQLHGHEIVRRIRGTQAEAWSSVKVGSVYHALNRMEQEDLVSAVRTERSGRRPERTIYEITEVGRAEFSAMLKTGLREIADRRSDPFDVALSVLDGVTADTLYDVVAERLASLRRKYDWYTALKNKLITDGVPAIAVAILQHAARQTEAEVHWHEDLLELTPEIVTEARRRSPVDLTQ